LSCLDETGLKDSSSVDTGSDSNEESHNDENVFVDEIDVEDDLGEFTGNRRREQNHWWRYLLYD